MRANGDQGTRPRWPRRRRTCRHPSHLLSEAAQAVYVARYRVAVQVAPDHGPQPAYDQGDRFVHATRQHLSYRLEAGTHPLARCQPLHAEPTVQPGRATEVGEPKE